MRTDLYDALRVDAALSGGAPVEVPLNQTFRLGAGLTLKSTGTLRFITATT